MSTITPSELRIAIDARPALWPRTGIGTIVCNVLQRIQTVDPANRYFAYFNESADSFAAKCFDLETRQGGSRQRLVWANTWLLRQLRRDSIDVFVTFLDKEVPLTPTRAKVVSMVHDLIPLRFPEVVFRNPAHRLYYNALIRAATRRSDVVLTNSEFSKQEIVKELGIEETKICKITLGVSPPGLYERARVFDVLRRYGLRRPYAIATGSTEPRKNNQRVIQATRLLESSHPDLRLAIVGKNWRGLAFDPNLVDERVCLLGHVADEDLPILMQSAEMLVFPSLHEGFGLPVIEAMSLGVPVVASNVAALPEVAGNAALLVDPDDAADIAAKMGQILEDPALADGLRVRGKQRALKFRWETTCAELAAVCVGMVGKLARRSEAVMQ